jgi:uncharacterized protein YjaZ
MLDFPEGLVPACHEKMPTLLRDVLEKLTSSSGEDYATYFLINSTEAEIPGRAGYYIGYLVAKEMHRTMTLDDMVKLQGDELRLAIQRVLSDLLVSEEMSKLF